MSTWRVRLEGSSTVVEVASAARVVEGLREGEWETTDFVRGEADETWVPIDEHPTFADAAAELEQPHGQHPDEARLDMNPLIDVALVLLIFFILTTTYSSLRRAIEVPADPETQGQPAPRPKEDDIKDRVFHLSCWLEDGKPAIKIEEKVIDPKDLVKEVKEFVKSSGRKEMLLEVDGRVPWGVEASILDAAKAADIHQIYRKPKKG